MRTLDQLRGWYLHAPPWVQSAAGSLLSIVPPGRLYGKTFRDLQTEIARSERDAGFVERRQCAQLARLFAQARMTPHYAALLRETDPVSPTIRDLSMLPILEKDDVRRGGEGMLAAPRAEMDEVTTGGTSSGVPLTFYLDKDRSVKEWAFLTHVWQRCGYTLGDRLAVLGYRGVTHLSRPSIKPWAWEPGTRELRLSPFRMVPPVMDEYLSLLARYRTAFIYGYPSAISILAGHARNIGWTAPSTLRGVLLMSESIRPFQRQVIREGLGSVALFAYYGLSEKVAMAGESQGSPDDYEFEPLYGVTELVDAEGSPVSAPGQQGRLVGTGFLSMGMPLIRYDTGDVATAVEPASPDNCWRLRVRNIVSRYNQDYLVTGEGGLLTRTVLNVYSRSVREFQFVQHEPGSVVMRVVPETGVGRHELEELVGAISSQADGVLSVTLETVDEIPTTQRGKRVLVEQHLDLTQFGVDD